MKNMAELRKRICLIWDRLDKGEVSPVEALVQVSLCKEVRNLIIAEHHLAQMANVIEPSESLKPISVRNHKRSPPGMKQPGLVHRPQA
jgi:hypothetical protein